MQNKTVLITGASGFVGRQLARYLTPRDYRVHGTYFSGQSRLSGTASFKRHRLDIRDRQTVRALIKKIKPDAVCHLAAEAVPRLSWKDPAHTVRVNTAGTIHLLDAILSLSKKTRLLFVSTNLVYGNTFRVQTNLTETALLQPLNPYAGSKALAELACFDFARAHGLDTVVARPFNHFGAGQDARLVFSDWCRQIALAEKGKHPAVLYTGNLDAERDFLHVDDVVAAYELLLRKGKTGEAYNIALGKPVALYVYIDHLLASAKIKMKTKVEKKRLRTDDPAVISGSYKKISALGWKPRKSAFEALTELLNDWRRKI